MRPDRDKKAWFGVFAMIFVAVLAFGWKYPWLNYCMFLNVAVGIWFAFRRGGRFACGNLCPRGAFYGLLPDRGRALPRILLTKPFGLVVPLFMLAAIYFIRPGTSWREWGYVFYSMIAFTTVIGLAGWLLFNRFFWCSMCPMGKIYRKIGKDRNPLLVAPECVNCGKCAKVCPFQLRPFEGRESGEFSNPICIRCERCVECCPKKALKFEYSGCGHN
ncbi:MAG: 4Fe-4S binding protein [Victivallaceae bacterium]|nr:4Fe-4S binding protein [Victivallaceae bacterium]